MHVWLRCADDYIVLSFHFRNSRRRILRACTASLLGAFLAVVYLCKYLIDHKSMQENVRKRWQSNKNSPMHVHKNLPAANIAGIRSLSADTLSGQCNPFPTLLDRRDKMWKGWWIYRHLQRKLPCEQRPPRNAVEKPDLGEAIATWIQRIFVLGRNSGGLFRERQMKQTPRTGATRLWHYPMGLQRIIFQPHLETDSLPPVDGNKTVRVLVSCWIVKYLQSLKGSDGSKHLFTGHRTLYATPIWWSGNKYHIIFFCGVQAKRQPHSCDKGTSSCLATRRWSHMNIRYPSPLLLFPVSGHSETHVCFSYGCKDAGMVHYLQQIR